MPELPEVETVRRVLKKQLVGCKIIAVKVYYEKTIRMNKASFVRKLKNQTIKDVKRRGKWLLFVLDDYVLISHLRMEGKYVITNHNQPLRKHQHVSFWLDNSKELRYEDSRKFGRMELIEKSQLALFFQELGPEPADLTEAYLLKQYQNKNVAIKTALLDQTIFVGVGNIYADEILFLSKINPQKKAQNLSKAEIKRIVANTKKVLQAAIELGGTTINTYAPEEGQKGFFQTELKVHNQINQACSVCHSKIKKIKVNNRGTYYCPKCQK